MRDAFDEIAAAIPLRALVLVRLENAGPEEQEIPAPHHHAVIQRPAQLRRRRLVRKRRQRREIGADRQDVVARQFGEIRIGEGRIIARAVGRHAIAQGAVENPDRSRRRGRYRGPASDWANRSRRTACRSACRRRTALRDRRYGSSRNRPPRSAPCRGRWSPPTARPAAAAVTDALHKSTHKNRDARIARIGGYVPRRSIRLSSAYQGRHVVSRTASWRHKPKLAAPLFPARNCDLRTAGPHSENCGARGCKNRHRLVLTDLHN